MNEYTGHSLLNVIICRKINALEIKHVIQLQRGSSSQRPKNPVLCISTATTGKSLATPSQMRSCMPPRDTVPLISEELLSQPLSEKNPVGTGCFGTCYQMNYKDVFDVCVKKVSPKVSLDALKTEAATLIALNSEYVPHCFGVSLEKRGIVMSYIALAGKPVSLHELLVNKDPDVLSMATTSVVKQILVDITKGLQFIDHAGFLHNDLKSDNVALGSSFTRYVRAYIIDFGKACRTDSGKRYSLSPEKLSYTKGNTVILLLIFAMESLHSVRQQTFFH